MNQMSYNNRFFVLILIIGALVTCLNVTVAAQENSNGITFDNEVDTTAVSSSSNPISLNIGPSYEAYWTMIIPPSIPGKWQLNGVHFTSPDEGWAVGLNESRRKGIILHYSNGSWSLVTPPTVSLNWELWGVHFTSNNEGWAVGRNGSRKRGVLLHYYNELWSSVTPPKVSSDWELGGVHFTSSNEGWAVGFDNANKRGVLLHYSNGSWSSITPPIVSSNWELMDVHFTSSNEGWAVGFDDTNKRGVLLHYSNGSWSLETLSTLSPNWSLWSVYLTSPSEGWAVGFDASNTKGILLNYSNGSWSSTPPPIVSSNWGLFDIYFISSNEGWAVGRDGLNQTGVLLHYLDGLWSSIAPPKVSQDWDLSSVHFTSSNEGWAVGWGKDGYDEGGVLLKFTANTSSLEWEQFFKDETSTATVVDTIGDVVVAFPQHITKFSGLDGSVLWDTYLYGGTNLALDSQNNVVVASPSVNGNKIIKCNSIDGTSTWISPFAGSIIALVIDSDNNVIVTGTNLGNYYTVKYRAADGFVLWEAVYDEGGFFDDCPTGIVVDKFGDIIVTGITNAQYYYTIKYNGQNGATIWHNSIDGGFVPPTNYMAIDRQGNPVLTFSQGQGFKTTKLDGSDGLVYWEKSYERLDRSWFIDRPRAILVDSHDNVVVAGTSNNGANEDAATSDYHTIKYSGLNGSILWEMSFDTGGEDYLRGLAIDSEDNVIVTGGSTLDLNLYTFKYLAADGTILWRKIFDDWRNAIDGSCECYGNECISARILLDKSNNIIITGDNHCVTFITKYLGSNPSLPISVTNPASALGYTKRRGYYATLNGTVTPNGDITIAWFEYGTTKTCKKKTAPIFIGNSWTPVTISTDIICLVGNVTYYFRAVSSNIKGINYGKITQFRTHR